MTGCACQQYGKSGVPHVASFRCLVCGGRVDPAGPFVCPAYRPDHNGECLTCDEPLDEHTQAAQALGQGLPPGFSEDRCQVCGVLIGIGVPALHLGLCEACTTTTRH